MIELAAIVWTILNINVFPSSPAPYVGEDTVLERVDWRACAEQEIDESNYTSCETGSTSFAPYPNEPGEPPAMDTVKVLLPDEGAEEITEEMVIGWVLDRMANHSLVPNEQSDKLRTVLFNNVVQQDEIFKTSQADESSLPWGEPNALPQAPPVEEDDDPDGGEEPQ